MNTNNYKQNIKVKVLFVKEWALKTLRPEINDDAERLLTFLESDSFDPQILLKMPEYQTVLRIWYREAVDNNPDDNPVQAKAISDSFRPKEE